VNVNAANEDMLSVAELKKKKKNGSVVAAAVWAMPGRGRGGREERER
jgi:hypothetical protein